MYSITSRSLSLFIAFQCSNLSWGFRRHPSLLFDDREINSFDQNDPTQLYGSSTIIQQMEESIESSTTQFNANNDFDRRRLSSTSSSSSGEDELQQTKRQLLTPDDHLVTDLPYLDSSIFTSKHYAGHLPASADGDKKFFYWLFEPEFPDKTKRSDGDVPLLIWLNGGPGCSSMDGLFLENGPFRLVKDSNHNPKNPWTIQINQHSWHKAPAYVLYIDQPVGTGLSFTKKGRYCKNDLEVNIDFHYFLENFLIMYEDFFLNSGGANDNGRRTMKRPLYFSGESHAGHYIPSMMDYILQRNDDVSKDSTTKVEINLKGSAIGNGWIDPYYQYAAADLAHSIGLIDSAQKQALDRKEKVCRDNLLHGTYRSNICFDLLDDIINDSSGKNGKTKMSIYDNRKWEVRGKSRSFPPGHKDVEAYLGGWHQSSIGMTIPYKDVLKAIHAEESISAGQRFQECTDPPYIALEYQDGKGVVDEFVRVLQHKTKPKMLVFNGMNDMICNHIGNEKLLDNLKWKHSKEFTLAKRYVWNYQSDFVHSLDGSGTIGPAGYYREYDNLVFLKIASSGHMVPMDIPDLALEMMRKLMFQESFSGDFQQLDGLMPNEDTTECPSCPTCTSSPGKSIINENAHNDDDNDDVEDADESRKLFSKDFVSGGWFGAVIGVAIMVVYNIISSKKLPAHFVLSSENRDDHAYKDEQETELVGSSRMVIDDGEYI